MPYNYNVASDPNLLSIPRACVDVALLDSNDRLASGWRHLGDVSAASVQFAFEEAEHFSSCGEQRVRNARVAVQVTADFSMTIDALIDTDNLELIFSGTSDTRLATSLANASVEYTDDNPTQVGVGQGILVIPNPYYNVSGGLIDNQPWARQYQLWRGVVGATDYIFGGPATGQSFTNAGTIVAPTWFPTDNFLRLLDADVVDVFDVDAATPGAPTLAELGAAALSATALTGYVVDPMYGTLSFDFQSGTLFTKVSSYGSGQPTLQYIKFPITLTDRTGGDGTIPHITRVRALTRTSRPVAVRLRQQDTVRPGFRAETILHKVRLIPNTQLDMISDGTDFSTATLEGSLELPAWADANTPGREGWMTRNEVRNSSSTT